VTGYLYHLTSCLLSSFNVEQSMSVSNRDILQTITKPLTKLIVQVNCTLVYCLVKLPYLLLSKCHTVCSAAFSPGNMCPGRAACICTYMLTDTGCWIQVARSGYTLTVSLRHNYYSFMSRSTCIPLYPATDGRQTGNNLVADTRNMLMANKWIQLVSGNMCPGVNAALQSCYAS